MLEHIALPIYWVTVPIHQQLVLPIHPGCSTHQRLSYCRVFYAKLLGFKGLLGLLRGLVV
eukprot:3114961-Amphidinium_carterae.1